MGQATLLNSVPIMEGVKKMLEKQARKKRQKQTTILT